MLCTRTDPQPHPIHINTKHKHTQTPAAENALHQAYRASLRAVLEEENEEKDKGKGNEPGAEAPLIAAADGSGRSGSSDAIQQRRRRLVVAGAQEERGERGTRRGKTVVFACLYPPRKGCVRLCPFVSVGGGEGLIHVCPLTHTNTNHPTNQPTDRPINHPPPTLPTNITQLPPGGRRARGSADRPPLPGAPRRGVRQGRCMCVYVCVRV